MCPVVMLAIAIAPPRPGVLLLLASLLGSAILASQVIVYAVASAVYPVACRGTGVGAAVAAGRLGSLVGPLFAASLLASGRSSAQVLIGVLPIAVAGGLCVGLLGWRELRQ
jgi:AAHS family 3-hydroxyphenylpropionic acid transporter